MLDLGKIQGNQRVKPVLLKQLAELPALLSCQSPEQAGRRALKHRPNQHPRVCWLLGGGKGAGPQGWHGQVVPAMETGPDLLALHKTSPSVDTHVSEGTEMDLPRG